MFPIKIPFFKTIAKIYFLSQNKKTKTLNFSSLKNNFIFLRIKSWFLRQ